MLFLDNISTLVRSGKENEAEGWLPVQNWVLSHRGRDDQQSFFITLEKPEHNGGHRGGKTCWIQ